MQRNVIQGYSEPQPVSAGPRSIRSVNKMAQIPANVYRSVLCAAGLLALGRDFHKRMQYYENNKWVLRLHALV
jgi:hypothetical protein